MDQRNIACGKKKTAPDASILPVQALGQLGALPGD